jgi:hypothetical protein
MRDDSLGKTGATPYFPAGKWGVVPAFPAHRTGETFENLLFTVTPAKAGVQNVLKRLDTGFRRYDDLASFGRNSKVSP